MVLVAQIIVDVPLMQTDRPYSYLVPESMQGQITIGMRIHEFRPDCQRVTPLHFVRLTRILTGGSVCKAASNAR